MARESKRIARLIAVQNQLKAFHEMRHAALVRQAREAARDAEEIGARKNDGSSLAHVFPELYDRGIARSLAARDRSEAAAAAEAGKIAAQTARANMLTRAYRAASGAEERDAQEKAALESVERGLGRKSGD